MPLKLNVGLSKKVGMPDYGSLGASVHVELELDSNAIADPDRIRQQIRQVFDLAKSSVDAELQYHQTGSSHSTDHGPGRNGLGRGHTNGHGYDPGSRSNGYRGEGNRNGGQSANTGRLATQSQVRAIRAISIRKGVDLAQILGDRFRSQQPEDLTLSDASDLIDELKNGSAVAGGGR